jgi:hypothetical protein
VGHGISTGRGECPLFMGVPTIQWIPDCARSLQSRSFVRQCRLAHIRSAPPQLLTHETVNVCLFSETGSVILTTHHEFHHKIRVGNNLGLWKCR